MKNPIKKPKNQSNMWSTENSRFCGKYIEKQPKTSQNSLFSSRRRSRGAAVVWRDFRQGRIYPPPCALKASFQIYGWDMRTRILLRKTSSSHSTALTKKRTTRKERFSFFGRSGGTRTRGLQYPKLARYQLRYTSSLIEIAQLL